MAKNKTETFRPGNGGACEAALYEFTGVAPKGQEPPVEHVAACTLEEAMAYLRKYSPDFEIKRVELLYLIAMVSGSPLNWIQVSGRGSRGPWPLSSVFVRNMQRRFCLMIKLDQEPSPRIERL